MSERPALFTPFALNGVTFTNRIVLSPMCQYQAFDGVPNEWHFAHYGRYAVSGVGAAMTESTGVSVNGRISPGCTGLYNDDQVEAWQRVTALFRARSIPVFVQINHAGAKASTARPWDGGGPLPERGPEAAWQTVAPSAIPAREGWHVPKALEENEIAAIVSDFARAAKRAMAAGFDGVEIHGAHGYLLHRFMSPFSNRRTDRYGGDLAGRMRMPLEVAKAVREALPSRTPVVYRASCVDGEGGGLTLDDSVMLTKALKELGIDMIDASGGGIPGNVSASQAKPHPGFQIPFAERIREEAGLATMTVGLITEPEMASRAIEDGKADCVALGRGLLIDPMWPYHAARALGLASPAEALPKHYGFYLEKLA